MLESLPSRPNGRTFALGVITFLVLLVISLAYLIISEPITLLTFLWVLAIIATIPTIFVVSFWRATLSNARYFVGYEAPCGTHAGGAKIPPQEFLANAQPLGADTRRNSVSAVIRHFSVGCASVTAAVYHWSVKVGRAATHPIPAPSPPGPRSFATVDNTRDRCDHRRTDGTRG